MFKVIETTEKNKWSNQKGISLSNDFKKDCPLVYFNKNKTFQTHMGFGGAFTEACSYTLDKVSAEKRNEVINAYFSKDGLNYNLGRIPIQSSDFSTSTYDYIEENDVELKTFSMERDEARLKLVKDSLAKTENGLWMLVSPWSPCAWMKDNNCKQFGGKLKKEHYTTWAKVLVRSIVELIKEGIKIDAITVQNEPEAVQKWDSCIFNAEEEALFIRDALYPELKANKLENIKIVIWDHNRDNMARRALGTLSVPGLNDLVWGVGYHWYCCDRYSNLELTHEMYPDKHLLLTECCVELAYDSTTGEASVAGLWEHGERYAKQIINDLNNYSEGYIDWNLILDHIGGPNYVSNFCEAPIMVNTDNGNINYMAPYYFIGHFSKYIKPGSKRIYSNSEVDGLLSVGYVDDLGQAVLVLQNITDEDITIALVNNNEGSNMIIKAHSIVTLIEE